MSKRTLAMLVAAAMGVGVCGSVSVLRAADPAQEQREPGGAVTFGLAATATVKAVDPATRTVTLTSSDGEDVEVKCGKRVRNFDQIKVGDQVHAAAFARLVVTMGDDDAGIEGADATTVVRTPEGEKPGVMVARTAQRTGKIEAVDPAKRTATVSGLEDEPKQVPIGKNVDLSKLKVGEEVTVRATRGFAIWIPESGGARPAAGRIPGGGEMSEAATATVTAVDPAAHTVTIKGAKGAERTIHLREGNEQFDRIKVGDKVRAIVVPEMAIAVRKAGAEAANAQERPGMAALEARRAAGGGGGKPGLLLAETDELKGKIESIDPGKHSITITEADGDSKTLRTAPRVELSELKVGDEVTARVAQPVAIKVDHQD